MQARLIEEIGTRAYLRVYWGSDCPSCLGGHHIGYHNAMLPLVDSTRLEDWELGGKPKDYPPERWPTVCDHCVAPIPAIPPVSYQVHRKRLYNTATGQPEAGDLYWTTWMHTFGDDSNRCIYWDNCTGPHLTAVLPTGHHWDIDSRAKNCTLPLDRLHRCWVRVGGPPAVDVSKTGVTCGAGAGSISAAGWHGFLRHGAFVE